MLYPLQHVGVGGKKLHHPVRGGEPHLLAPQLHQLIIINGAIHIPVNLRQLPDLIPGTGGIINKECLDPLHLLQLLPPPEAGIAISQLIEGARQVVRLTPQPDTAPVSVVLPDTGAIEDEQVGDEVEDKSSQTDKGGIAAVPPAATKSAAETGHLVLSTLHTIGAAATIDRIIDVFPPYQQPQIRAQLALVLEGVLSQVLLPRADGDGRIAAFEVMLHTYAIGNLIREARSFEVHSVLEVSSQQGMQTLDQALRKLVEAGLVTIEEALTRAHKPQELRSKLLHAADQVRRAK